MSVICSCASEALCPDCYQRLRSQLEGTANFRGARWARKVAVAVGLGNPWPSFEGKCAEKALKQVFDLTSDPRLRAEFAEMAAERAATVWATLKEGDLQELARGFLQEARRPWKPYRRRPAAPAAKSEASHRRMKQRR
jgi:hypothetical protein